MTEELTVKEALECRRALEKKMEDLVNEFNELTGLLVDQVDVDLQLSLDGGGFTIVSVRVILPS